MREDDKAAWVQWAVSHHGDALTRYAARITGDPERARDVVQHTFLRLWEADRAAVGPRLPAWLYTVCRHAAIDVRRKEVRMSPSAAMDAEAAPECSPAEALAERQEAGRALAALARLPEQQQEVLRLRLQSHLSYREIAEVTGLTVGNVGYLIHVGLKEVRAQLGGAR